MFILIILIAKVMLIIALDRRFKDISYELKNQFKSDNNLNVAPQNDFYPINTNRMQMQISDYGIKEEQFENQMPYKIKYSNEDAKEDYVRKNNHIFGWEDPNYDYNYYDSSDQMIRRETPLGTLPNTSLYPSVLTKALEISLNASAPVNTGGNLLNNVAQKMNTSALDLAKMLTKTESLNSDDQFSKMIENYKRTKDITNPGSTETYKSTHSQNEPNNLPKLPRRFEDNGQNVQEHIEGISASNLAAILDDVLNKLEIIQEMKTNEDKDEHHPDGVPCDIIGCWSSAAMGLCFDIQLLKDKNRYIPPAEINNKILSINVSECIPAKQHQIIDMEWKFTGSALKQWGGPFYLYGQKRSEGTLSTFLGFCRTCNGLDTIFGSWNILSPTKDCHDASIGNEVKPDILRRVRMESKRKERFKNLLYQSRHGKL